MNPHSLNYQIFNKNSNSKFLLLCDHATNRIPESVSKTHLNLTADKLREHIAFDLGAKEVALLLSKTLRAPLITADFSRLVIDPNRSTEDPTSIMQIYDGVIISGNCNLSKVQINDRRKKFYNSYHNAISNFIKNNRDRNLSPCLISIHSFTPQLSSQPKRPWHIGVLWDKDIRMSSLIIQELTKYKEICIGENKPYKGNLKGDTLSKHGTANGLPHVLIEIRNDLISNQAGQKKWAEIIGKVLKKSIEQLSRSEKN